MSDFIKPASGARRIVLICLICGIVAMLAASLAYRVKNPSLVVESKMGGGAPRGAGGGMNPEIGALMEKLRDNPNDAALLIHLTEHLISDQNWTAAETFARRAVAAEPGNSQPMYLLGLIQHNQLKHAEAAASLERALKLKDEPSVRYSLGVLYIHYLKDPAKGIAHLSAALHDASAGEQLKELIRAELEKAPMPSETGKTSGIKVEPSAPEARPSEPK